MIRFIHTADIHFGMENYGKIDPATGIHSRLTDFVKALNACIDTAIEQDVDFFLFCGDAYKTATPSPTQQTLLIQCFLRLYQARIPIVIIVGNHDHPLSFGKSHALDVFGKFPVDGFHIMAKPASLVLNTKSGPVQIVGIPWPTRNTISLAARHADTSYTKITEYISSAVTHIIKDLAQKLDPAIPAVLAGHLTVSSGVFSGSEKKAIYGTDPVFLPSQLAIEPFDYVALGHLHRFQNLNPHGFPAIIYSGSPERVDFGEHKEDKGFCLVSIKAKGDTHYEFIKTPTRPFIQIEVTLNPSNHTEQLIAAISKRDVRDAILKIIYHLPEDMKDEVDLKAIQRVCASAMYVVGIIPVRKISRERRISTMSVGMDLPTALTTYFESKDDLKPRCNELLEKSMALLDEIEPEEEH